MSENDGGEERKGEFITLIVEILCGDHGVYKSFGV